MPGDRWQQKRQGLAIRGYFGLLDKAGIPARILTTTLDSVSCSCVQFFIFILLHAARKAMAAAPLLLKQPRWLLYGFSHVPFPPGTPP